MQEAGYHHVIAPVTVEGARHLQKAPESLQIFIPTVHTSELNASKANLYYGGIDYQQQINALLEYAEDPLVIFYDTSRLGEKLKDQTRDGYILRDANQSTAKRTYSYGIDAKTSNLKRPLKTNRKLVEGTFFLNTPIVKTGMIMSQLTLYDVNASTILSTQINYDPLLFTITQYQDRKPMKIANSILIHNSVISEANTMLNNDIEYDWINYATTIGADMFHAKRRSGVREYPLKIEEAQIQYPIEIVWPGYSKFSPLSD